jgi:hypothetical protein
MSLLPVELPEYDRKVKAVVKSHIAGTDTWDVYKAFLIAVYEDDCVWRFADDNSELSYSADVIYWEYADK